MTRKLSYANVTATLALVVATTGGAYAAGALPAKSVGKAQLKKNAVVSKKVKDGSLTAADLAAGVLPKPQSNAITRSVTASADLGDGDKQSYTAFCQPGEQALGGGGRGDDADSESTIFSSSRPAAGSLKPDNTLETEPPADGQTFKGWRITVTNPLGGVTTGIRPTVWVVCVVAP